jgi:hypothetical protein
MSSRCLSQCCPVAPTFASPVTKAIAFVTNEGGGRCVRGLDRPSPRALQTQQPGQAAGRIGWGCLATRGNVVTPTWNAIGLSLPVVRDARSPNGSLSPWHSFLPPRAHRRRCRPSMQGEGKPRPGPPRRIWPLPCQPISSAPPCRTGQTCACPRDPASYKSSSKLIDESRAQGPG